MRGVKKSHLDEKISNFLCGNSQNIIMLHSFIIFYN
jgi:hypothetical protein